MSSDTRFEVWNRVLAVALSLILVVTLCVPVSASYAEDGMFSVVSAASLDGDGDDDTEDQPVINAADGSRYCVLIVDISGSMWGEPMSAQKVAAQKFCESVLSSEGENHVALVAIDSTASELLDFTDDADLLVEAIEGIYADGGTNIEDALRIADSLISRVAGTDVKKNVVLCTDGLPESGIFTEEGRYSYDEYYGYGYANTAYGRATGMWAKCSLYTLGFFHDLSGADLEFGQRFLHDLQNAGYYEVNDPEELEFRFGDIADSMNDVNGKDFYYDNGYKETCYYTDAYFKGTSFNYQPSLSTMSLCLAMSAFGDATKQSYAEKSANVRYMMNSVMGIEEDKISTNSWFTMKPTADSIACAIGSKPIVTNDGDETLVAIAVRGGGYESEWASNFTIGTSGNHSGFNTAKTMVESYLKLYLKEKSIIGPVKFLVTGYSRAAATANLVSGELADGISLGSDVDYGASDVFCYCFETPAGLLKSRMNDTARYGGIFNIVNPNDPVPYVAPQAMGFGRYGTDKLLPSKSTYSNRYADKQKKMLQVYNSMEHQQSYDVDDFQMKKLELDFSFSEGATFIQDDKDNNFDQGTFLSQYVTIIAKDFLRTRSNYVSRYEDEIREICKVFFGADSQQNEKFVDAVIEQAKQHWGDLAGAYLNPFVSEEDALNNVSEWLLTAIKEAGITDYDEAKVRRAGINLGDLLLAVVSNHPNYATTMAMNVSGIGGAHYPELCFAWLASMDDNYIKGSQQTFGSGNYRIIRINCDVYVEVRDAQGDLVALIDGVEVPELGELSLSYGINADGEKFVVVPSDADYRLHVTGLSDGDVNVCVSEYDYDEGCQTRLVNYFDVSLDEDESFYGDLPQVQESEGEDSSTDATDYQLYYEDGAAIDATSDMSDEEAANAYNEVWVSASDEQGGIVNGNGLRAFGSFAQVSAQANDGYTFDGWYKDGTELVSTEADYRFCVKGDADLTARFVKPKTDAETPQPEPVVEVKPEPAPAETPIVKKANTMKVKVKTKKVKASALAKKAKKVSPIKVTKAVGNVSFKKVSGKKKISVNAKTGKVTLKKGLKKGTYKVKAKVKAAGNDYYNSATKTVTVKLKVT